MSVKSPLVIVLCLQLSTAWAAIHVVGSDYPTIQAAIDAAQDGDSVVVPPGTYAESIDFGGKAITVTSNNPQDWEVVCDTVIRAGVTGGRASRSLSVEGGSCVVFASSETSASILEGLTLTNGSGTPMVDPHDPSAGGWPAGNGGGGIFCRDSSPTIRHCNITGNQYATYGGGIALVGDCSATISHCVIVNNRAQEHGGGILIATDSPETAISRIVNCTIADNEATFSWAPDGGYEVDCGSARPVISNTIIYGSQSEGLLITDLSLVTYSCLKSVYAPSEGGLPNDVPLDFTGVGGNINRGPWLTGSAGDDIDPMAYHIAAQSPCVDAGDPNDTDEGGTDIDGQARVMGGRIDIGADEVVCHLAVDRPTRADIFAAGSTQEITWSGYTNAVDILFSQNDGANWQTLATSVTAGGSYLWQLPEVIDSNACIISVVPSVSDPTVILSDSGRFTIHPDAAGPEVESKWPSLGGDYGRSGLSENEGLAEGGTAWEQDTGGAVISSVTLGFDGRIHAACEDGKLYTFDAGGAALWTLDVNAPLLSAPSIGPDGSLFVGGQDGKLRAISPDGTLRWTYGTGDAVYSSAAVAPNGNVYFGSCDGILYAVGPDGSELWRFPTKGPGVIPTGAIFASASIGADGTVYTAGLYDPNLYALDPADGSVKWVCNFELYPENSWDLNSTKVGGWPFASPVVGTDGTIYQTLLYDSHLYAIEPSAGTILWATDLLEAPGIDQEAMDFDGDADGWSEPALGPDGTIYVSLDDPYLRAVAPDGTIKWATKLGDAGAFTLTVDRNGWVYAACDDGYVYVVDPDGLQVGRWETSGWPIYPVIAADGTVLVGDSKDYSMLVTDAQNTVRALSIESLQDPAPEPEPEPEPEPDPGPRRR